MNFDLRKKVIVPLITLCGGLFLGIAGTYLFIDTNHKLENARAHSLAKKESLLKHSQHQSTKEQHNHGQIEAEFPIPQVQLQIIQEPDGTHTAQIVLNNFVMRPEKSGLPETSGEGHAHIYIDEEKVARVYGQWHHLGTLPEDAQSISVVLSTNDHKELTYQGELISDTVNLNKQQVTCPTQQDTEHTICYTKSGYYPSELEINKSDTVAFVNTSQQHMWTASDNHPEHSLYQNSIVTEHCQDINDPSVFDQCQIGRKYIFSFEKAGVWPYHNHMQSKHGGVIIVR